MVRKVKSDLEFGTISRLKFIQSFEWGRQWDCLPKICGICKHVEQVVLCLLFLLGELTALPKPSC